MRQVKTAAAGHAAGGTWRRAAPFPEPTWEMEAAVCGGRLYLIGGITNAYGGFTWTPNRYVYEYDPAEDRWSKRRPLPAPSHHISLAEHNGRIYCFGGFGPPKTGPDAWVPIDDAWEYDPAEDRWTRLPPLPTRRGAASAVTVGGRILIIGGACHHAGVDPEGPQPVTPHCSTSRVDEFDPQTGRYRERAPLLTARNHHMAEIVGDAVYVLGGRVGSANIWFANKIDLVEAYSPAADAWTPAKARLPRLRSSMIAAVHRGRIVIAGGEGVPAVEIYDPSVDAWSAIAAMPRPRMGLSGAVIGDALHLVSGHVRTEGGSQPVGDHDVLTLP